MKKNYHQFKIKAITEFGLKSKYVRLIARHTTLGRDELWASWLADQGLKNLILVPNKNVLDYYFEEQSMLKVFRKLADNIKASWKTHIKDYYNFKKRYLFDAKKLALGAGIADPKAISKLLQNYTQAGYKYGEIIWNPWAVICILEPEASKIFGDKLTIITTLDQSIEFMQMERDLFRLSVKKMEEKYAWLKICHPGESPYTQSDFIEMKRKKKNLEVKKQFEQLRQNKKRFNKFLQSIKNPQEKLLAKIVHTYAYLKTERIDTWKQGMFYYRIFLQQIVKQSNNKITLSDAASLSVSEILDWIKTSRLPKKIDLEKRSNFQTAYIIGKGKIQTLTNQKAIKNLKLKLEQTELANKIIKGTTANKGIATGKVKIIFTQHDLKKINKGDIFVAKFTYPSFTPYIKLAGAVITDEGGLTTHAAIVSRELGIPCIVGAKTATHLLTDGDLVEVDANNGTVKKI